MNGPPDRKYFSFRPHFPRIISSAFTFSLAASLKKTPAFALLDEQ